MKFTEEQKNFIENKFNEGLGPTSIWKEYNLFFTEKRTIDSIKHYLRNNGMKRNQYDSSHFSSKLKSDIIDLAEKGLSSKEIGEMVGRTTTAINSFLHRNGMNTSKSIYKKLTKEEIEDIINMYINGDGCVKIRNKYAQKIKAKETIIKIIKDANIPIRDGRRYTKIENENFFEKIDSEAKAYILGFLITDGFVCYPKKKNSTPYWGLCIHEKDEYILEFIKKEIGVNKKIVSVEIYSTITNKKTGEYTKSLTITSAKMVKDLEKYGIIQNKSHIVKMPQNIPEKFMPHFIRGVFDGDGCITKRNISFVGNKFLPEAIIDYLHLNIDIPKNKVKISTHISKKGIVTHSYCYRFEAKKDVKAFYEYIYKDATIYLTRKKEKFELLDFINPI